MTRTPVDRAAVAPPVAAAQPDPARDPSPRAGRAGSGTPSSGGRRAAGKTARPSAGHHDTAGTDEGTAPAAKGIDAWKAAIAARNAAKARGRAKAKPKPLRPGMNRRTPGGTP